MPQQRRRRSRGGASLAAGALLALAAAPCARAFYIPGAFPNVFAANATLRVRASAQDTKSHDAHEGEGRYSGRADDVIGVASGQTSGNAFQWSYTLSLPVDDRVYEVQFDDWMYLMDDRVMLNKARMSKWGIYLGEVTLAFTRRGN